MRTNQPYPVRRAQQQLPIILLFGAAAFLFVAGVVLWWATASSESGAKTGPRLAVDQQKIDFGRVPLDKSVRAVFTITNAGDSTLTLDASSPIQVLEGCWPPTAVVGATTLAPGQTTTLSTEFMMHKGMEGKHLFDVRLTTNDPTQLEKHLLIASDWEASNG